MPRPRSRPLFELAGQWIARDPGSRSLYRFWNDARIGRTRRQSLCTTDLEAAKRKLAEIVVHGAPKTVAAPLSVVLLDYFESRTDELPSKKPARQAGKLMLRLWGDTVRVSTIDATAQREFAQWSLTQGHSLSYVSRNLSVLAAALAHAGLPAKITYREAEMQASWGLVAKPRRVPFVPSDDELARFLSAPNLPDNLFRWLIISMLTGCRPEAAMNLSPAQRLRQAHLVDLNPAGRAQNKKFRPIVRAPAALEGWLDKWESGVAKRDALRIEEVSDPRYCTYASLESAQTAIERIRAREDVNLPRFSAYSIRHKVVTVLRMSRISGDEIAVQVGHRRPDLRTTSGYGEWSPDYLSHAAAALDRWFAKLQRMVDRPIFAARHPRRRIVKAA